MNEIFPVDVIMSIFLYQFPINLLIYTAQMKRRGSPSKRQLELDAITDGTRPKSCH